MAKKKKSKMPPCPFCFGSGHLDRNYGRTCSFTKEWVAEQKIGNLKRKHRPVIPRMIAQEELDGIRARDARELDPLDPLVSTYSSRDRHNLLCHLAWLKEIFDELTRDEE